MKTSNSGRISISGKTRKEMQALKINVSHPDPKIEKQGAEAVMELIKAISALTGEEITIIPEPKQQKEKE